MNELRLLAERAPWLDAIEFLLAERRHGDPIRYHGKVIMEEAKDGVYLEPSFVLRMDAAQQLMDELWHCGLRPTEGSGSAGSLAATQAHLKDLQGYVERLLAMVEREAAK